MVFPQSHRPCAWGSAESRSRERASSIGSKPPDPRPAGSKRSMGWERGAERRGHPAQKFERVVEEDRPGPATLETPISLKWTPGNRVRKSLDLRCRPGQVLRGPCRRPNRW